MNGLLQQLDRVSSETVSHHHQRPKEKICSSPLTLPLKAERHTFDDSDHVITELTDIQHKGALLWNGCVENSRSEHVFRTKETVILNGTESVDSRINNVDFVSGFEAHLGDMEASSTMSHNTHLEKPPNLISSSDNIEFPEPIDTSDKLRSVSLQKTPHVLQVTDHPCLSSLPSDSAELCDQNDVAHSAPNHTSQFSSNLPTHTRSLSQTASQLTSLIERADSCSVGDTRGVNNLFEVSNVKVLSEKCGNIRLKNESDTHSLDKPQISPCYTSDLRTEQDPRGSTEHSIAPAVSDTKEETTFESSPEPSQCSGEVLQSPSLDAEAELSSVTHSPYPNWKLDRRESGHLFWRRDSSTLNGIDPSSRVKFRYDIEVREFESRNSEAEDLADDDYDNVFDDDDDDEVDVHGVNKRCVSNFKKLVSMKEDSSSLGTSAVICVVAIIAIVVMASYRWLLSALSLI